MQNILVNIVRVNKGEEALWEGDGVGREGGQFSVVRFVAQDLQVLAELVPPLNALAEKVLFHSPLRIILCVNTTSTFKLTGRRKTLFKKQNFSQQNMCFVFVQRPQTFGVR